MASDVLTNLAPLGRTRKPPKAGEIFTFQIDGKYYFGRVISTDTRGGFSIGGAILVYLYRHHNDTPRPAENADLTLNNLLLPPLMTNRLVWSRGYFKTVQEGQLSSSDVLQQHCFLSTGGRYYDEQGQLLQSPVEPCGDWGLNSFRTIDDQVSDALGIARVPEDR